MILIYSYCTNNFIYMIHIWWSHIWCPYMILIYEIVQWYTINQNIFWYMVPIYMSHICVSCIWAHMWACTITIPIRFSLHPCLPYIWSLYTSMLVYDHIRDSYMRQNMYVTYMNSCCYMTLIYEFHAYDPHIWVSPNPHIRATHAMYSKSNDHNNGILKSFK